MSVGQTKKTATSTLHGVFDRELSNIFPLYAGCLYKTGFGFRE